MAKTHLTMGDRIRIEGMLNNRASFAEIGRALGKDRSTISREVQNHSKRGRGRNFGKGYTDCEHRRDCHVRYACDRDRCNRRNCVGCKHICGKECPEYREEVCRRLLAVPYVCNGCKDSYRCTLTRATYEAGFANAQYERGLKESRRGVRITEKEAKTLQSLIKPLVARGQSLQVINLTNGDKIGRSTKTLYNYVNMGVFPEVKNIDLPRKVVYKPRRKKMDVSYKRDRAYRNGRRKEDYDVFIAEHPGIPIVQMDTVESPRVERRCILTLQFQNCSLQLGYLRETNSSETALKVLDDLKLRLGSNAFKTLFPVILTDNGSEFSNPEAMETDEYGEILSRVFYCHPLASWEKGDCENNHELIRRILPKSTSFASLTQGKVSLMMDHINSYPRPQYNGKSAFEMFVFLHGQELAEKLGLKRIRANDVTLKPSLIE